MRTDTHTTLNRNVNPPTGIEVNVVEWTDGKREIALNFKDFNQLVTLDVDGARNMAFLLMECADFVEPPFAEFFTMEKDGE